MYPVLIVALLVFVGLRGPWLWRLLVLLVAAPLLPYLSNVFGFAIRLQLSEWAGTLLRAAGFGLTIEGNLLIMNGQPMSVDPACMGVRMMGITLLVAVFWLIAWEKRLSRRVPLPWVLAYGGVTLGVVMLSNLIRIVVLVGFGVGPDHPMHELTGLACVVAYAWLPLVWLSKQVVKWVGIADVNLRTPQQPGGLLPDALAYWQREIVRPVGLHWDKLLLASVLLVAFTRPAEQTYPTRPRAGYVLKMTSFGFAQYSRPAELIYVKPLPDWFSAEHSPAVCWKGQGYTLRRVREAVVAGRRVYLAELRKGQRRLQTAWWFSNGRCQSISQVEVRSRMVRGEPGFALINVTAMTDEQLEQVVKAWL